MTNRSRKLTIVAVLAVAVATVIARREGPANVPSLPMPVAPASSHDRSASDVPSEPSGRPRLVDLGAQQCVPCRLMAPVLDDLRREYTGVMDVVFIDVWKNPDAGTPYRVDIIPTQIFFDGTGRELYRHQGFIAKEDILATWKRLGYDFGAASVPPVS